MNKIRDLKINTILNFIKTGTNIIFPLITFPYISRVLLPDNVGKINFGSTYVNYFTLIATLGITTYAVRECSKVRDNQNKLEKLASEIFSINICTTIVSYIFLALSLLLFEDIAEYRQLIIVQSMVILFTTLGADWLNTAMEDFVYITIRSVLFQLLSLVLMFIFVKKPDDYIVYALITVLSSSGANIANIFYRKKFCKTKFTLEINWKKHLFPIVILFVMILSQTIFTSADVTMLGLFKGDYEVGIYSTAVKLERLISQIVSSIVFVLMPRLSYMFGIGDYEKINILLRKVLGTFLLLGIPCFVGTFVMSEEIIFIIAGSAYMEAVTVLKILLFSFLFSLIGGSFLGNVVLLPSGKEVRYMIICCIATIFNVVFNAILIPTYGVYAAAFTTACSSFLIMIMLLASVDKKIRIVRKMSLLFSPIVGGIIIYVFCLMVKQMIAGVFPRLVVSIGGSIIVYGITVLIMKNEVATELVLKFLHKAKRRTGNAR